MYFFPSTFTVSPVFTLHVWDPYFPRFWSAVKLNKHVQHLRLPLHQHSRFSEISEQLLSQTHTQQCFNISLDQFCVSQLCSSEMWGHCGLSKALSFSWRCRRCRCRNSLKQSQPVISSLVMNQWLMLFCTAKWYASYLTSLQNKPKGPLSRWSIYLTKAFSLSSENILCLSPLWFALSVCLCFIFLMTFYSIMLKISALKQYFNVSKITVVTLVLNINNSVRINSEDNWL